MCVVGGGGGEAVQHDMSIISAISLIWLVLPFLIKPSYI